MSPLPEPLEGAAYPQDEVDVMHDVDLDDAFAAFSEPLDQVVAADFVSRQHVTAILVSHDGQHWLPDVVDAVRALRRGPEHLIAIDTGSTDDSAALLEALVGVGSVVGMPTVTGFGDAIRAGLAAGGAARGDTRSAARGDTTQRWLWLLHDDCAPAPDALQHQLEAAAADPNIAIVGAKAVSWEHPDHLREVGLSITGGGRRFTGLEPGELDQGQHDQVRPVLAVGSAGLLIREDVWELLGGFAPDLPLFRDDVDLGWRANGAGYRVVVAPHAVLRHAEAASRGKRALGVAGGAAHRIDRTHALRVVLAHASSWGLPFTTVRMLIGGVLRALGLALGKAPARARDELVALRRVVGHPHQLADARRLRAATLVAPDADAALRPSIGRELRLALDTLRVTLEGGVAPSHLATLDAEVRSPSLAVPSVAERVFARPWLLVLGFLVLLMPVAGWPLRGEGMLAGGALLPAPNSAWDLLRTYAANWHPVGLGSATPAPPYLGVVGVLGTLLLGSASAAVSVLLLATPVLAAASAGVFLRRVVAGPWLRAWGMATWGVLPVVTGAVQSGRLGTCLSAIVLPLFARSVLVTLGRPTRPGPVRPAWTAGLLLTVITSATPVLWPVALALAGALVVATRSVAWAGRLSAAVLPAPLLLAPWSWQFAEDPTLLAAEAGIPGPGLSDANIAAWQVALLHAGGPGSTPWWFTAPLVVAGLAALIRHKHQGLVVAGWVVALSGFSVALLLSRTAVRSPTFGGTVPGWPAPGLLVAALGLIVAVVLAASGLRAAIGDGEFSWRQPAVAVVAGAALLFPLAGGLWWVGRTSADPLERRDPDVVPAYVAQEAASPDRIRSLVLRRTGVGDDLGSIRYAVLRGSGPQLGDAETGSPPESYLALDALVGDLVGGRGAGEVGGLADFAIRYLVLPTPADPVLVERIDGLQGLVRASSPDGGAVWRLASDVARVQIHPLPTAVAEEPARLSVPSDVVGVDATLPDETPSGNLVLAETADDGWVARLDGQRLVPKVIDGWAQGFSLPSGGGTLTVEHTDPARVGWLAAQALSIVALLVLALPSLRGEAIDDDADVDEVADDDEHAGAA